MDRSKWKKSKQWLTNIKERGGWGRSEKASVTKISVGVHSSVVASILPGFKDAS